MRPGDRRQRRRVVVDQPTDQLRRRFLGRKVVTLLSSGPQVVLDLPGVTRRATDAHAVVLDVDTRLVRVEQVITAALAQGGVEDITIEDPPMEEVIHDIYASALAPR